MRCEIFFVLVLRVTSILPLRNIVIYVDKKWMAKHLMRRREPIHENQEKQIRLQVLPREIRPWPKNTLLQISKFNDSRLKNKKSLLLNSRSQHYSIQLLIELFDFCELFHLVVFEINFLLVHLPERLKGVQFNVSQYIKTMNISLQRMLNNLKMYELWPLFKVT